MTTPNRVRVLLADDHPLVRSGIRATLLREGNIDVVGEAANGAEVQTLTRELCPDLLLLATELAGVGGADLPLEVSAIDSYPSATDPSERSLTIVARVEVSLARVFGGQEQLCDVLDRCADVSHHLLDRAPAWLGDDLL